MQIQNPTSSIASNSTNSAAAATPAQSTGLDSLANGNTFLQLLVSQIKNQDPLNPTDSVQFMSQLTQMSQLEQMVAIRQDLDASASARASTTSTAVASK